MMIALPTRTPMRNTLRTALTVLCCMLASHASEARTRTVGLLLRDSSRTTAGYTLFSPLRSRLTYLIDINGMLVHSWTSAYVPGQSVQLESDGSLLRAAFLQTNNPFASQGGVAGRVERFSWDGTLQWAYEHCSANASTHHDAEPMPNGNVLLIAWEKKTMTEAVAAGRNTAGATYTEVWSEKVIEVKPTGANSGTIVWEWHIWDHLIQDFDATKEHYGVVSDHPELMDINFGDKKTDWLHMNAIRYNAARDEIMLSVHATSELLVIDHSTTTAEAASHSGGARGKGGDILYRWGNPRAYKLGATSDQKLYSQHDARWIGDGLPGAGNIMIFNNGTNRPGGNFSSVEEIVPPLATDGSYTRTAGQAFGPASAAWTFSAKPTSTFYSVNIGGATRIASGNTVVCEGANGKLFEVAPDGSIVWVYMNPVGLSGPYTQGQTPANNQVFKVYRYSADAAPLSGRTLTPVGPIELYPTSAADAAHSVHDFALLSHHPEPFAAATTVEYTLPRSASVTIRVHDALGRGVATLVDGMVDAGVHSAAFDASVLSAGVYFCRMQCDGFTATHIMHLQK